jgi:cbb3-type cytochrome oxidase maturation protein
LEILWLLIPMSAVLVLLILAVFGWALHRGQFEDLEHEGERILLDDRPPGAVDADQAVAEGGPEESPHPSTHSQSTT